MSHRRSAFSIAALAISGSWTAREIISTVATSLLPSFMRSSNEEKEPLTTTKSTKSSRRQDTAYLDGLRGLAASAVYAYHFMVPFSRSLLYGSLPSSPDSASFFGLPIIGFFRSAATMVNIFFIISGYVLSLSTLRAIHWQDWEKALHCLSTAALKRGIRLFVPAVITSLLIFVLFSGQLYANEDLFMTLPAHWVPLRPRRKASLLAQFQDWLDFVIRRLTNPWRWNYDLFASPNASYYGAHLWTIQTEFHCSLVLFFIMMALSRIAGSWAKFTLSISLILYSCLCDRWEVAMFLCGMIFAERDIGSKKTLEPKWKDLNGHWIFRRWYRVFIVLRGLVVLCTGLWLASYPELRGAEAIGFSWLAKVSPSPQVWQAIGASCVVWSAANVTWVRSFLATGLLRSVGGPLPLR
ncbi:hypothetical protein PFICI_12302 [Pestalotiopsis fici W106-1]|uniref:Acyltransferase 3 domain-containing protein n=1 Tax=Pestalotiopsis fici (strain W106-1 / CGMCC3.15140) TaxID=1229662 RepID=W3WNC3_PESFW|nr:uncharacterized protein PFICI_12302 [Pestalotiopsis fici W106-1]ETS75358.1 hypothetical protein PFICI_12302 [Pestalotiopsis fici W106-1]